jgi:DNA-directed RNA polymerase subunit M/transcription elongation factor TFIIS
MSENHHPIRDVCVSLLVDKASLSKAQAQDVETGIFNWCVESTAKYGFCKNWVDNRFLNMYKTTAISAVYNLDSDSYIGNHSLKKRMNENEFSPHEIPYLEKEQCFPEMWKGIADSYAKKEFCIKPSNMAASTDQFRCGKCRKNKCSYSEMQTRSADESTTIFVNCLNCGNRWRC